MEIAEKNGWGKLISCYTRKYGEYKKQSPESNFSSQKVSDHILKNMWRSGIPYYYLGKYLEKYTDYNIFCKVFFKMKNRKRYLLKKKPNPGKGKQKRTENPNAPFSGKPKPYEEMSERERESLGVEIGYENYND